MLRTRLRCDIGEASRAVGSAAVRVRAAARAARFAARAAGSVNRVSLMGWGGGVRNCRVALPNRWRCPTPPAGFGNGADERFAARGVALLVGGSGGSGGLGGSGGSSTPKPWTDQQVCPPPSGRAIGSTHDGGGHRVDLAEGRPSGSHSRNQQSQSWPTVLACITKGIARHREAEPACSSSTQNRATAACASVTM